MSAAEQAEKLLSLQQELEARYQSEQQAQEARHSQAVALLAAEKSAAEQALHTENRKVIADQKRLLSDQQQAYEKLLGELKQKEEALKDSQSTNQTLSAKNLALQDELKRLQSSLPQSPSGVVSGPQTPSSRPALSPAAATLSSFGDSVLDASVWERYYGAVDSSPSPPSGIDQILNSPCPFWRGKQVKDTHLLALIPSRVAGKLLTLDYLGELIKSPKGDGHKTQYRAYWDEARKAIGSQSPGKSYWVLMTRDVLDGSRNQRYNDQCALVSRHQGYTVPGVLEAAVVVLLHHVRSGERLYSDNPYTYTRCQEKVQNHQLVVWGLFFGGPQRQLRRRLCPHRQRRCWPPEVLGHWALDHWSARPSWTLDHWPLVYAPGGGPKA